MSLLAESVTKMPDSATAQYHLGMALLQIGDRDGARRALAVAVGSPANFPGRAEAKKALEKLN